MKQRWSIPQRPTRKVAVETTVKNIVASTPGAKTDGPDDVKKVKSKPAKAETPRAKKQEK